MKTLLKVAAVAALLTTGTIVAAQAEGTVSGAPTSYVQMDSPGDGLDGRRAVREGNARPYRAYTGRRMYRPRYRRGRLYRRYR